jgi:membrane protein
MAGKISSFFDLLKRSFKKWSATDPFSNSIVIAYYTIFSLPGLLVIIINIAGYFLGDKAVTNQISSQISGVVGADTAKAVEEMIANASVNKGATLSTVLAVATLIFGATGVFYQLRQILNKMWEVKPKEGQKIMTLVRDRATSFGLILVVGFLLLVSLVLSAAVGSISKWIGTNIDPRLVILFGALDIILSIAVITLLFAAMFKFVPDIRIRWKDVWPGAVLTSVLFVIAKFLLGIYFAKTDPGSTYGAAGSIVLIMLWVTYSALILLFGAQFTKVYARSHGEYVRPAPGATRISAREHREFTRAERTRPSDLPDRHRNRKKDDGPYRDVPPEESPDTFHYEPPA